MKRFRVALCGNPNVGKSTVFNALTGMNQHTGNWAGKTVDTALGLVKDGSFEWELVDLPGAYSLFSGSPEEVISSDYLTFHSPDAAIVVCDAVCLERNLNLALQIAQACPKTVLCINMMDEARKRGIHLNLQQIQNILHIPVVGISARRREGLKALKECIHTLLTEPVIEREWIIRLPESIHSALEALKKQLPSLSHFAVLRSLVCDEQYLYQLEQQIGPENTGCVRTARKRLLQNGVSREALTKLIIDSCYQKAAEICRLTVSKTRSAKLDERQLALDRMLSRKAIGIPAMLMLLAIVLYLTIIGANGPSQWLSGVLVSLEPSIESILKSLHLPSPVINAIVHGVYRVTCWVVSVMLPPMAIFFPLFTLLEDSGFLPRVAFHLDRCFQHCHACGKQALCICMGMGCNAVGVTGCRIIQSPRERLIAILTNALTPCNGRFPTLLALMVMFLGAKSSLLSSLGLCALLVISLLGTFACSYLLSRTLLKGIPSSFALELPPFRRPKFWETMVRSVFDRTLFVLGRAISVAAPAGLIVWLMANVQVGSSSILNTLSGLLDPLGKMMGMDGVILLAFLLGLPANEIVLPLIVMIYMNQGELHQLQGLETIRLLLVQNGWTLSTALCVMIFTLFHWPCSTTILTIRKETGSLRWTAVAILLPTLLGCTCCMLVHLAASVI